MQGEDTSLDDAPLAEVNGHPFVIVTIIDKSSDMDARVAPFRERLLRDAFEDAIKSSPLNYAYTLRFQEGKSVEYVPELIIEIADWKYVGSNAFECSAQAKFIDALKNNHNLKGSIGVESTLTWAGSSAEMEEYLEASARRVFEKLLRRILKKGLYRAG